MFKYMTQKFNRTDIKVYFSFSHHIHIQQDFNHTLKTKKVIMKLHIKMYLSPT